MSIIVSNCQHCDKQQFQTLSCGHYTILSLVKLDFFIRALLLDRILALEKTTRALRVHLVNNNSNISLFQTFVHLHNNNTTLKGWIFTRRIYASYIYRKLLRSGLSIIGLLTRCWVKSTIYPITF